MAVTNFIPEVWSARLQENLHRQLVFGGLCNRWYEGDIRSYGDTVHINSLQDITVRTYTPGEDIADPEQLSGTDTTLTIDHAVYCNFFLSDVDAAQTRADVMEAAMRGAARRLAEDTETYLLGVIRRDAGIRQNAAASADLYSVLLQIKTAMDLRHVPRHGRCLVVPPTAEAELLKDARFVTAGGAIAEHALADGAVARAAGFDIYVSTDLTDELVALTEEGVTFAQQIAGMEAYRREKGFDDGVKALSLCGAKVLQPDCVAVWTLSA
ncbi:MAG: hypothetical protein IKS31_10785 [Clostridia bacterium]|nr:hypothetical protein [Clostridia bacterium]